MPGFEKTKAHINCIPIRLHAQSRCERKKHPNSPTPPKGREIEERWKDKKVRPLRLTYGILTKGLEIAIFNYHTKTWNKVEATEYLRLIGVSSHTTTYALNYASTYPKKTENIDSLLENFKYPSLWKSNIKLDNFIETPMHHIFEGIVKSIIEFFI